MHSVFEQSWQEFEYIIIDGGSTDGSKQYLEMHAEKIHYWVSEKDSGIYNAMNKGIKAATGKYLLFLNSGDHFYHDLVLEQNILFLNKYDLIYFDIKTVSNGNQNIKKSPTRLTFSYFINDTLPHQSTFIKDSLFEKVGFYDESLMIVSDWKFFVESICKFNATYLKIGNILSTHYLDGLSAVPENWPIILEERKKVLESEFKLFVEDGRQLVEVQRKLLKVESIISKLRNSKKVKLLIALGFLKKF